MSEQELRNHLRRALATVVDAEKNRVSAILNESKIKIVDGIEKMKPITTLIRTLKEEVGEVDGLEISTTELGDMVIVRAQMSVTTESLSISTNHDNSVFVIEICNSDVVGNSYYDDRKEYTSTEDVMARVLDVVGKHIGAQQAQQAHKDA